MMIWSTANKHRPDRQGKQEGSKEGSKGTFFLLPQKNENGKGSGEGMPCH
jgi:hypothetical protein